MKMKTADFLRWSLFLTGWISLAIGIIGIFMPILPTAPFVILSAYCFAKSSPRFHHWLLHHPILGPPLRDWESGRGLPLRTKWTAVITLAISLSGSMYFFVGLAWVRVNMGVVGLAVAIYIFCLPTKRR